MHIYTIMSFIIPKFHEILSDIFRGVAMTICFSKVYLPYISQSSKFKRGITPRKIIESKNFLHICAATQYVLYSKFHKILLSAFRGIVLTKKGLIDWRTDRLTDRRVKNIIPSSTRCVGYNYHKISLINVFNWLKLFNCVSLNGKS